MYVQVFGASVQATLIQVTGWLLPRLSGLQLPLQELVPEIPGEARRAVSSRLVVEPPGPFRPHYCLALHVSLSATIDEAGGTRTHVVDFGRLVRLELRSVMEGRTQVLAECHGYPGVRERLQSLGEALRLAFPGWIELPDIAAGGRRRGGRPPNPANEWAREQVNNLGRPRREVYPEWLERLGEREQELADPWDSFQKVLRVGRGGR
jgi:hypothetical protein